MIWDGLSESSFEAGIKKRNFGNLELDTSLRFLLFRIEVDEAKWINM